MADETKSNQPPEPDLKEDAPSIADEPSTSESDAQFESELEGLVEAAEGQDAEGQDQGEQDDNS